MTRRRLASSRYSNAFENRESGGVQRQEYIAWKKFKDRDITLFTYWQHLHDAVPWDKFPEAVFLKKHVLGLPVHQDINFNHLDRILDVLKAGSELYVD